VLEEYEFFEHRIWGDMLRSLVGIALLWVWLSKLLLSQIASELPSLIDEIKVKYKTCCEYLQRLSQLRTTLESSNLTLSRSGRLFNILWELGWKGPIIMHFLTSSLSMEKANAYRLLSRTLIKHLLSILASWVITITSTKLRTRKDL
jgi:hypothetical protein